MEAVENVLEATANWLISIAMLVLALCELAWKQTFRPGSQPQGHGQTQGHDRPLTARHTGDDVQVLLVRAAEADKDASTAPGTATADAAFTLTESNLDEIVTVENCMLTRRDLRGFDDWCEVFTLREYLRLVVASQDYYARLHLEYEARDEQAQHDLY